MLTHIIQNADRERKGGADREGSNTSRPKVKQKIGWVEYDDKEEVAQGKWQHMEPIDRDKWREKGEGMIVEE